MSKQITDHFINSFNRSFVEIEPIDAPSYSGAHHEYRIVLRQSVETSEQEDTEVLTLEIKFQKGSVRDAGVNGITDEALLAILIDRLKGWQGGPFNTSENETVKVHLETALLWLMKRSSNRLQRGVEGTLQP